MTICIFQDCNKHSTFNIVGESNAIYCKTHAKDDMIDVISKKCIFENCDKFPNFNTVGESKAIYCKMHAKDDMIDVKSKRCIFQDCNKQSTFNTVGESKAIYCKTHAKDDMIDVINKRCIFQDCNKRPNFNIIGKSKAIYCKTHAKDDMINVIIKRCETCNMTGQNFKYKPNCSQCHFFLNPNDPRIRNYKTKEDTIMKIVSDRYPNIVLDSIVNGGCSRRRPDGVIDLFSHVLIIEVDENEHRSYDDSCNNRRTMELYTDFGNRPLVFIRLNPDAYTIDRIRHKGIFSITKNTGALKANSKELLKRSEALLEAIELNIMEIPYRSISVVYLFFSDN